MNSIKNSPENINTPEKIKSDKVKNSSDSTLTTADSDTDMNNINLENAELPENGNLKEVGPLSTVFRDSYGKFTFKAGKIKNTPWLARGVCKGKNVEITDTYNSSRTMGQMVSGTVAMTQSEGRSKTGKY